jgi:hypothetical protein
MLSNLAKTALAMGGLLAVGLAVQPAQAASPGYCTQVANAAVANDHPRRGLLGTVVAIPFDVTGAVLTGYTSYDLRQKRVYDAAYADCMSRSRTVIVATNSPRIVTDDWMASCAARYRSFDPATGTYVRYDGRVVPCR